MKRIKDIVTKQTSVKGLAREVLKLYEDPARFHQGSLYNEASTACCAMGAVHAVVGFDSRLFEAAILRFSKEARGKCAGSMSRVNDELGYDTVVKIFRRMAR